MSLLLPSFIMVIAVLCFGYHLRKVNGGNIQIFELGLFYVIIISFYFYFPITVYLLNGMEFLPISDIRLYTASPTPQEMSEIAWYYIVYLLGFTFFYALVRGKKAFSFGDSQSQDTDRVHFTVTIFFYLLISLFISIIKIAYHLDEVATYGETYAVYWQLPTFIRQLYNHAVAIRITLQILLIIVMVNEFKKYRYLIYALIFLELINAVITMHSRSVLLFSLLSFLLAYNYFIRRLKTIEIVLALTVMLSVFLIYGHFRAGSEIVFSSLLGFFSHNEFEAVFGTLFDYNRQAKLGDPLVISYLDTWLGGLENLIPQQIYPFDKVDISHLYSMTYIPGLETAGGGYPGGTLLEAIMGLGLWDAFLKGAMIGMAFCYIYRKCILERRSYVKSAVYIWIVVLSYKTFSRGTFMMIPSFFYDFLAPVIVIGLVSVIIRGALKPIPLGRPI